MTLRLVLPRRRRSATVGAVLLMLLCPVVAGCDLAPPAVSRDAQPPAQGGGGGDRSRGPVTIGYSPLNQNSEILVSLGEGLKEYAATKRAKVIIADPENSAAKQVQQLTEWVESRQVQAIWAIPVDAASLAPVFDLARAKGIAVLATGTPEDYGQTNLTAGTSYSFIDYTSYGNDVGRSLGECANARLQGRARALFIHNPTGIVGASQFETGLRKGLAATSPQSRIVALTEFEDGRPVSQQSTSATLRKDPGVNAVIGANDDAMLGAVAAFTQAGKDPAASCVLGAGGGDEAIAAVKGGTLYAVAALGYEADLVQNVDQMLHMVAEPQELGMQLLTPITTVKR